MATDYGAMRTAMEKAIEKAEENSIRFESGRMPVPPSKAEAAIRKLRKDRRLTREELDRPTIARN